MAGDRGTSISEIFVERAGGTKVNKIYMNKIDYYNE